MIDVDDKRCCKCGEVKETSEFHRSGDGFQSMCKGCMKIYCLANREKRRELSGLWYIENKEQNKRSGRKWKERNKEQYIVYYKQYYADHKEAHAKRSRKWHENNPGKRKAMKHRYRATKRNATIEKFLDNEIFERDNWMCGICGKKVDKALKWPHPQYRSLDHIIPLSKGGTHTRNNTQCSHLNCNKKKNAAMIEKVAV